MGAQLYHFSFQATAPKSLTLGDALLEIEDTEFELKHKMNGPWEFKIEAVKKSEVGGVMQVTVKKAGEEYALFGTVIFVIKSYE